MEKHCPLVNHCRARSTVARLVLLWIFVLFSLALPGCQSVPVRETGAPSPSATSLPTETPAPTPFPTHIPFTTMPTPDQSVSLELVGQNDGGVTAYAVNGNRLFVAIGANLRSYDITNPSSPQQVGNYPLNALANSLVVRDNRLFALDRSGNLLLLDVEDLANFRLIKRLQQVGNSRLFLIDGWGLATMETCLDEVCASQVKLFPLADLENQSEGTNLDWITATAEVPGKVLAVEVSGDRLYIGHTKGVRTARLSDLETVGDWTNYDPIRGVAFNLPYVYLNSQMFIILDLTNLSNPGAVYRDGWYLDGPSLVHDGVLWGFQRSGYCAYRSVTINLANGSDPRMMDPPLASFNPGCIDSFTADNGLIFLNDHGGLNIFNIDRPGLRNWIWLLPNEYGPVEGVKDGQVYGIDLNNRPLLWKNDARDLQNIETVRPMDAVWASNMVDFGQFLLIAGYEDGLMGIDADQFGYSETIMGSDALGGIAMDVAHLDAETLLVARLENGVAVVDFKDLSNLTVVGEFIPQPDGENIYAVRKVVTGDGYAAVLERYLNEQGDGVGRVRYLDLDDPTHPADLGTIDLGKPYASVPVLFTSGEFLYSLTSNCAADGSCSSRILVLQVKEGKPRLVQMIDLPYKAIDLYVLENYMFLAVGEDGVQVWDISNLGEPRLVGQADTAGMVEGVAAEDGMLYVSDGDNGLAVFKYSTP